MRQLLVGQGLCAQFVAQLRSPFPPRRQCDTAGNYKKIFANSFCAGTEALSNQRLLQPQSFPSGGALCPLPVSMLDMPLAGANGDFAPRPKQERPVLGHFVC